MRREQRAYGGDYGAPQPAHHNGVPLLQLPVHQHHVDGGAQALNLLHLQHGALQQGVAG